MAFEFSAQISGHAHNNHEELEGPVYYAETEVEGLLNCEKDADRHGQTDGEEKAEVGGVLFEIFHVTSFECPCVAGA